ncbi:hypothetical protein BDU57DRAFT_212479 [Ampelomyces quisqualis]|uniref:Uncharacterized protein n=1 Tax=Ampelomyces quisqualis TaxID=50730 RepID=A0A6A5QK60_AMPQU|nr:hypothetical protein BDU57DRAFT_212479 [Ampelomyces quisqualis]
MPPSPPGTPCSRSKCSAISTVMHSRAAYPSLFPFRYIVTSPPTPQHPESIPVHNAQTPHAIRTHICARLRKPSSTQSTVPRSSDKHQATNARTVGFQGRYAGLKEGEGRVRRPDRMFGWWVRWGVLRCVWFCAGWGWDVGGGCAGLVYSRMESEGWG